MKRGRAWLSLCLVLLLTSLVLTGCWDRRELEERTSVVALAIDRVEQQEGQQPLVKLTVQIPIPIKIVGAGGGESGAGGKTSVKVMSATGFSMNDAITNLQQRLNQELFYGHTRVIAVSEDIAREGLAGIVDALRRSPQMRRLLWLVITPGEAEELLHADPRLEQIPIVYVMDLMENGAKQGRYPDLTLGRWFIDRSSTGVQATANVIESTEKEVKWKGTALFRDDLYVGSLDENESWILLQVRSHEVGGDVTIPCPESAKQPSRGARKYMTVHPKKIHVEKQVTRSGDTFNMRVDVLVETDVTESMCELDFTRQETFTKVKHALEEELNDRARKLIQDLQQTYKVDPIGMGNYVRAKYLTDYEKLNWTKEFPKTKLEIVYRAEVRRVGMKME
ncbi:MAG TPA: Ger(x)C family spore germination protein [Bacilli bacterium]|nr:Ger(x)C family spore germination protein [Bacilli bacterium]